MPIRSIRCGAMHLELDDLAGKRANGSHKSQRCNRPRPANNAYFIYLYTIMHVIEDKNSLDEYL